MLSRPCTGERWLTTRGLTFRSAALAGLFVLCATPGEAQPAIRQVLVLQSFARGNLILDHFTGNFRVDLEERAGSPVNIVEIVVAPTGFAVASEQTVVDYIRSTFAARPQPDLIVTIAGPASVFARKHRQQLFPDTPILFAAVDERYLAGAPLGDNETAVAAANDFARIMDDILQLRPQTKQVLMIMGAGSIGRFWRRQFEIDFKRFHDRLTFVWTDDLSFPEILRRCATLPEHSAIFYLTFGTDAAGGAYADTRVLADLRAAANAPLFAGHNVYIDHGIVGGTLMSIDELGRNSVDVAIRLLKGESPGSIRVPPQQPGPPLFDWRELQRWSIDESRLPPNSVVRFRAPSLWHEYKLTVLGAAAALIIQSLLIVGLLYQRRARQRAEFESRRSLALAADASRRQTMSALTNSMTHELGQPLSAMIHNARALQMMITADSATLDTTGEILADIQAQGVQATQIIDRHRTMLRSHDLDKKPIDLHSVIQESLALVDHDLRAREINTTVELPSNACIVIGDQVLLKQVMVNLVLNAMDAMAGTPLSRRRITIRSEVRAADVGVSVSDTGTGLPAQLDGKLFTPFVTTKPQGLGIGLTIVRSIVDAHGGDIDARNNPDGGATFTVTLPCSQTATMLAAPEGAA
jgi:signal transduction histidine kinase